MPGLAPAEAPGAVLAAGEGLALPEQAPTAKAAASARAPSRLGEVMITWDGPPCVAAERPRSGIVAQLIRSIGPLTVRLVRQPAVAGPSTLC
jgi:hypothetical protein